MIHRVLIQLGYDNTEYFEASSLYGYVIIILSTDTDGPEMIHPASNVMKSNIQPKSAPYHD